MAASVVILEDDNAIAQAMVAYLQKKGVEALATARVEEAKAWLQEHRIKLMIVDCLLPGESGVDFVQSLRKNYPAPVLDVVLMSGIFIEPNFMRESLRGTQAVGFLRKPFDLSDVDQYIQQVMGGTDRSSPRKTMYQIFGAAHASLREKRRSIEMLEDVHGFDLPFIYSFLHHSKISGHLNIADNKNHVFGITFSSGAIVGVDLADSDTFLGKLLIESGFVMPEDLDQVLNSPSNKKIGDRLISAQLLSPHGFQQVLANQMSIRISRTILDAPVRVNFVASEVEMTEPQIDSEMLLRFIHDWVAAKLTVEWLRAHFTPFGNSIIVKGPEFRVGHPCFSWPLVSSMEKFVDTIMKDMTFNDLLEKKVFPEETFLKGLHFLMCAGAVVMQDRPQVRTLEDQQRHLRNVQKQFHNKNAVEIYDLMVRMTTASENNPSLVYHEFILLLGQPPSERNLALIYADIRKTAEAAFEQVKSGSHLKLKDELMKQEVEKKLKASSLFDQARGNLERAQYAQALNLFEKIEKLDPKFDKIRLYIVWARLGNMEAYPNKQAAFKVIDQDLLHVAPEDKFDAIYIFVMGLYLKAKGDMPQAKRNFERAVAIDNQFIAARRELTITNAATKAKPDVFNQDLKTLVGSLFRSKK